MLGGLETVQRLSLPLCWNKFCAGDRLKLLDCEAMGKGGQIPDRLQSHVTEAQSTWLWLVHCSRWMCALLSTNLVFVRILCQSSLLKADSSSSDKNSSSFCNVLEILSFLKSPFVCSIYGAHFEKDQLHLSWSRFKHYEVYCTYLSTSNLFESRLIYSILDTLQAGLLFYSTRSHFVLPQRRNSITKNCFTATVLL